MPSYKTMWQEAQAEAAALQAEVNRLRKLIASGDDEKMKELERTRQVVDLAGIARHMRVQRFTPQQWKQRGHLPPPDFPDISEPLWYASTIIEQFAKPSRRAWYDTPSEPDEPEGLSPVA